jgi:ABC-type multidrug transport system fused ATPase/permease subunit
MLGIIPPVIIQNILDGVIVHQNVNLLHLLIAGLIISNVFTQLMATTRAALANFMVRKLDFAMMSQFFKHTLSLPYSFFAKRKTGDIFARFQENQTIRAFLTESSVTTVLNLRDLHLLPVLHNVKLTLLLITSFRSRVDRAHAPGQRVLRANRSCKHRAQVPVQGARQVEIRAWASSVRCVSNGRRSTRRRSA